MLSTMKNLVRTLFSTQCPHCRSIDFRDVGVRNATERAFHWLVHPYRCALCGHHFFLFRWRSTVLDAT
jgi:transposase-like protein